MWGGGDTGRWAWCGALFLNNCDLVTKNLHAKIIILAEKTLEKLGTGEIILLLDIISM